MNKSNAMDLGTLKITQLFRKYFIPTLLGMLSMSTVAAVEGSLIGHGIGSDGLAAINICMPLLMLFTGIGLMAGTGASVISSILLSKGKQKAARINTTQSLLFVTVIALLPSALMLMYPSSTARLLGASYHLTPLVREYLLWFIPSLLFQMWCSVCLFLIRLDGSPKVAMCCNIIAALLSVLLGWLFILQLGWGLMGAGLAYTISMFIGGSIGIIYLTGFAGKLKLYSLKFRMKDIRPALNNISEQCRIGSSTLLTETTLATFIFVGNWIFMKYLGDDGVGAFGIACYYIPFVYMVGNAIAQSVQPIISFNFGLGQHSRVTEAERMALLTSIVSGLLLTSIFVFFPHVLVGFFIDINNPAARLAIEGFPYFSAAFVFFIINLCVIGYYQSIENVKPATIFAILRGFIFLIPCFLFLPQVIGTHGIWLALFLSEAMTVITIVFFYRTRLCKIQCKAIN